MIFNVLQSADTILELTGHTWEKYVQECFCLNEYMKNL